MGRVRVGSPSPRMSRDEHVSEWMSCVRACLLRLRLLLYLLRGSVAPCVLVRMSGPCIDIVLLPMKNDVAFQRLLI